MIPKIIHYCWFGGNNIPKEHLHCIDSWKQFMPEYEIKEWNESNFDLSCCQYVKEAYDARKWAFVSDYARFWILYNFGGIYLDTDVELLKSLEPIITQGPFMAMESKGVVAPGLGLAAYPKMKIYKVILNSYHNSNFYQFPGIPTDENVVGKVTKILLSRGFNSQIIEIQKIAEVLIYPPEFFCPKNYKTNEILITNNTYSIHHYAASWINDFEKKIQKLEYGVHKKNVIMKGFTYLHIMCLKSLNKYNSLGFIRFLKYVFFKINSKAGS